TLAFAAMTGSLVDSEGSALSSLTTFVLLDEAAPVLRSDIESVYRDTSGNGVVDRVVLRFTEDVNTTYDAGDWTVTENDLAGLTITSASGSWASSVTLTATADGVQTGVGLGAEPEIAFSPVLGQIVDRSGNSVDAFSRTLVDDASPLLVSSSPLDGATGVALDTDIVISFSETMDINTFSFSLSEVVAGESLGSRPHLRIYPRYR
ncbi:hypothetical protein EBT31_18125, partial [bacterium]|nr:hypothetical protein [bacterium]